MVRVTVTVILGSHYFRHQPVCFSWASFFHLSCSTTSSVGTSWVLAFLDIGLCMVFDTEYRLLPKFDMLKVD